MKYLLAGSGVALILMGLWVMFLNADLKLAQAGKTAAEGARDTALAANTSQAGTIAALRAELKSRDDAASQRERDVAKALSDAAAARALAASRQRQLDAIAQRDAANAECQSFLSRDLAQVCPNVAQSIRERAQ